jgi:16S rRNA (adenine1518-N6/adenine1519-N6)-dimethyltransferase
MEKHIMKKKFGQNFLTDKNLLNKIVTSAKIDGKDVLEIGPGQGALTNYLVKYANTVTAYEVDNDLTTFLRNLESKYDNLTVIFQDILEVDLPSDKEYHVVANIPYNITSPIIFKILDIENIKSATLMVQKEVCDRITSLPNSKTYNALSVIYGC